MACRKCRRGKRIVPVIDSNLETVSLNFNKKMTFMSRVSGGVIRAEPGIMPVYQRDLYYWIKNGMIHDYSFVNPVDEANFLVSHSDIKRSDYV